MPVLVGDVVRIFDGTTKPPKHKRFLCVCAVDGYFLRINSNDHWKPSVILDPTQDGPAITHKSYLELKTVLEYIPDWIQEELGNEVIYLGRLSDYTLHQVNTAVASCHTLNGRQIRIITTNLTAILP